MAFFETLATIWPVLAILADTRAFGPLLPFELARRNGNRSAVFRCFFRRFRECAPNLRATGMGQVGRGFQ